jgi:hypothetical protein
MTLSPPPSTVLPVARACKLCQSRKVKCDREEPCGNCSKARMECLYIAPNPPKRRKRKAQDHDLLAKVQRYESILKCHGIALEESPGDEDVQEAVEPHTLSGIMPDSYRSDQTPRSEEFQQSQSSSRKIGKLIPEENGVRYVEKYATSHLIDWKQLTTEVMTGRDLAQRLERYVLCCYHR